MNKFSSFFVSSNRSFGSVYPLGDVNAVKVIGSEGTVALGALPLPGVVAHLQTFVAEDVETLGENRLLVSRVAAWAAQLRLQTNKHTCAPLPTSQHPYYLCLLCSETGGRY